MAISQSLYESSPYNYRQEGATKPYGRLFAAADFLQCIVPLSMRGLLVLLILAYLVLNPIWHRSDIVASALTASLLGMVALSVVTCAVVGMRIRQNLNPTLILPSKSDGNTEERIVSGENSQFLLSVGPLLVPPFFLLSLELCFENDGASSACHLVTHRLDPLNPLTFNITFPHRGIWRPAMIRCTLEDRFGFSCLLWSDTTPSDLSIRVYPPKIDRASLPVISSTYRPGDDLSHHTQRMGEPFDLKPYHPSDGIKKILWKVFAKSGQLIARHPEHAVTPEGHVVAFVLAPQRDDALAAWALAYFSELEQLNLTMEVGCLGMDGMAMATSPFDIEELLIASAFDARSKVSPELASTIRAKVAEHHAGQERSTIDSIALFISESLINSELNARAVVDAVQQLEQSGMKPVICFQRTLTESPSASSRSKLSRPLAAETVDHKETARRINARNLFLKNCSARHIKVFQEPLASSGGAHPHA